MSITYTEQKVFNQQQVQELFLAVGWVSGQYPSRLYKALQHSSTVLTAWDSFWTTANLSHLSIMYWYIPTIKGRELRAP